MCIAMFVVTENLCLRAVVAEAVETTFFSLQFPHGVRLEHDLSFSVLFSFWTMQCQCHIVLDYSISCPTKVVIGVILLQFKIQRKCFCCLECWISCG